MNTIHKIIHHNLFESCLGFMILEGINIMLVLGFCNNLPTELSILLFVVLTSLSVMNAIRVYQAKVKVSDNDNTPK